MIRIEAAVSVEQLAQELAHGWLAMRSQKGHKADHVVMALGGRKDTDGAPGSPLEKGFWVLMWWKVVAPMSFFRPLIGLL